MNYIVSLKLHREEKVKFCVWKLNWSLFCFRNIKKLGSSLCFVNGEKLSKYQSFRCKQSHNHLQPVLAWVKRHQFKLFESQFKVQVQDEADSQARKTRVLAKIIFLIEFESWTEGFICSGHVLEIILTVKLFGFILLSAAAAAGFYSVQTSPDFMVYCRFVCLFYLQFLGLLNIDCLEDFGGLIA